DEDTWSTMIIPGSTHVLEYGWRASNGVKNGLLNGLGFDQDRPLKTVPAISQLRFTVTNYNFRIMIDGQIQVNVHAFEDQEFNMRQAFLGTVFPEDPKSKPVGKYTIKKKLPEDPNSPRGKTITHSIQKS